jgi:SEC-C motif-containing protein
MLPYAECCGPIHDGVTLAPTAERLMRARYSAFALGNVTFLLDSWHASTRPASLVFEGGRRWLGLEIVARTRGGMLDTVGTVQFIARFSDDGVRDEQRENSRFVREGKRWLYVSAA